MELKYKPDIEQTLKRHEMWWNREDFGRCAISINAPNDNPPKNPPPELPSKVDDRWLDFDYIKESAEHRLSSHSFLADSLPVWHGGYPGHEIISAFLGCDVTFSEHTGWIHPIIADGSLSDYNPNDIVKIDPNNHWWQHSQKFHKFMNECAAGNSFPATPAFSSVGDILADMRTSNNLLFDLLESPEMVKKFEDKIVTLWTEVFDHYYDLHKDYSFGGNVPWLGVWAPGKCYIPQNDFSIMISTQMFEEIFFDALTRKINFLDYSIYHLDGVDAFRHTDLLCSIEKLNGIQVLPGAGKPSPLHYMEVLKKVQSAGKNLHISISPDEVKFALDSLSSKGLFIETWIQTEAEGAELLQLVEKYSRFI